MKKISGIRRGYCILPLCGFLSLPAGRASAAAWTMASYKAEVLAVSYDVKKAAEDADIESGRYFSELAAFYLPAVTLNASDDPYSVYNNPHLRLRRTDVSAGVTASMNLYNNFKDKLSLDSTRASTKISSCQLWEVKQNAALTAMQAYYGVLRKKRLLAVVRNSLASYQDQYDKVKEYYSEGMKSYSDLLKSELNVRSSQLSEASAVEDYRDSVMDLNLSVYRDQEENDDHADEESGSTEPVSGDGDVQYALAHRPELQVDSLLADQAGYTARKDRISRWPDVSVDAYYYRMGIASWGGPTNGIANPNYYLQASLSLPIGVGTISRRQTSFEADVSLARAKRDLHNEELQVRRDVVSSRLALSTAVNRYDVSVLKSGISKQSLEIVKGRYADGRSNIVELADAQNDDLQAQSDLANALYDLLLARASYDKALGRKLW
jgi:outer membrane protein